ncbi:glycoside hydrolase/deacetylase [Aspergillus egyptiacus]|nr:glycoside hydrolase/deacetylase [Aspergillus egyptiacus]
MGDRQATQQNINGLLAKFNDADPDMRYMSLNDLYGVLTNPNSAYLSHDQFSATKLAEGLLKALDDQHGDVQNQALKCLGPLVVRLPFESLRMLLEKLANLTSSQTIDTSVPNTALRVVVTALPRPQRGQAPSSEATSSYNAVSEVLIPRLIGPTPSPSQRRNSVTRGMLEKDPAKGFSSDAIDVVIQVASCFGTLMKEKELTALEKAVMTIIDNDTAGTVVTKRALAAISALIVHFSDSQFEAFVRELVDKFNSPQLSTIQRRHLVAAVGSIARTVPGKFGPHLPTLAPFVFSAVGEDDLQLHLPYACPGRSTKQEAPGLFTDLPPSTLFSLPQTLFIHLISYILSLRVLLITNVCGRNIIDRHPEYETVPVVSKLRGSTATQVLLDRDFGGERCGSGFGRCSNGNCCSTAAHCRSPDCQIDYGHCDAHATPGGPSTESIPRPKNGNVPYGPTAIRSCTTPGTVALTYDDGPNQYTRDLLDLLDKYEAKVTFFVTGNNNGKGQIDSPEVPWASLIQRMVVTGHQVASHTWSHQDLDKISQVQRRTQLLWNEVALRNILGAFPTYMRPPYSSCTTDTGCLSDMGDLGYHVVLYDIDTEDYSHDSPEAIQRSKDIFDENLARAKGSHKSWLVIAHDVHEQTVHNLTEHMLKKLKADGYRAVTVGECLGDPEQNWYRKDNQLKTPGKVKPQPPVENISTDGKCGGKVSGNGYCGNSTEFCAAGCQPNAGYCESDFDGAQQTGPGIVGSDPLGDSISGKKYSKSDASSLCYQSCLLLALVFISALAFL